MNGLIPIDNDFLRCHFPFWTFNQNPTGKDAENN